MPLPDPHAEEEGLEIPADLWALRAECLAKAAQWRKEADDITKAIQERLGNATAVLVAGQKVATYRPTARYAEAAMISAYPGLTQHYIVSEVKQVFNVALFAALHPEIAEPYRVRSFREVAGG